MCKLVTVGVLPLWLSFSAQCNLSLSEWGILLLSFMIIVLIYLHNILMFQDVAAPVVVFVMFVSYFYVAAAELLWAQSAWCSGASQPDKYHNRHWNLSFSTHLDWTLFCPTSDIFLSLLCIFVLYTINKEVRHWADCPNPLHVSIVTSWVWSLTQSKLGRAALTVSR